MVPTLKPRHAGRSFELVSRTCPSALINESFFCLFLVVNLLCFMNIMRCNIFIHSNLTRHHNMPILGGQARLSGPFCERNVKKERYNHRMDPDLAGKNSGRMAGTERILDRHCRILHRRIDRKPPYQHPGSSGYFLGGVVSYANQAKMQWLGVKTETLAVYGAVSRQTVEEMAWGLAQNLREICPPSSCLPCRFWHCRTGGR